ncbi:MAG: helix-turn-helix domain-containing protein [Thermoanaerobaculia bacterium]
MKTEAPPRLLTPEESGEFLRLRPQTVRRMAARGLLPYYRINGRGDLRFAQADLLRFLEQRRVEPRGA